jgi:protein gp37/ParB-like chromosome segregation protein Spo0J
MQRHPLCDLFPPMNADDFATLIASLKEHGFDPARPIITYEDKILDGANRWRACRELGLTPKTVAYHGNNPLGLVVSANLARRHLDESQRAMIADKIADLKWGQTKVDAHIKASQPDAARLLHVSRSAVQAARVVREQATPELVQAVERGMVAVSAAKALSRLSIKEQGAIALEPDSRKRRTLIKQGKRKAASLPKPVTKKVEKLHLTMQNKKTVRLGPYSVAAWEAIDKAERCDIIAGCLETGTGKLNKQESDSIEWARWSHNTVTGCLHNCPYCYARDIAERFPYKFVPMFHPERLSAPVNTEFPATEQREDYACGNIFANSMSDLFGQWVPADWIEATLEMARRNPKWRFLTLTKFPQRANEFEFPDNVWMGTTVDAQSRVANAEAAFATIQCKTKWLSVEPLLQPLHFEHLERFQWIVIGGASRSEKTPEWVPPFDWIADLQRDARAAGCRVYHKTNLMLGDHIRVREFPWIEPRVKALPKSLRYLKGL